MAKNKWRIARTIGNALGGDDADAPPVHLPRYQTRPIMQKVRIPVPNVKTDTAMDLVLIARDVVKRSDRSRRRDA